MKKTITIFILGAFLLSMMPMALADGDRSDVRMDSDQSSGRDSTDRETRTETRTDADSGRAGLTTKTRTELRTKIRERQEEGRKEREERREQRTELREDFKEARMRYKEKAQEFRKLSEKVKECKDDNSERCITLRKETRLEAKAHLLRTADKILALLERTKERIEQSNSKIKTELVAELDAGISEVTAIKARIEALEGDATRDEIKGLNKELKQVWKDAKHSVKLSIGHTINFGVHGVLVRAEKLETRLETALEKLEANGKNTDAAEAQLEAYKQHLIKAREFARLAQAEFDRARHSDKDFDTFVKKGHDFLVQARAELTLAHDGLKMVMKEIRAIQGQALLEAETEDVETEAELELSTATDDTLATATGAASVVI